MASTQTDFLIQPSTINQRVYARLCEALALGRWPLGTRIDERIVASQLGVSRTPLREAIGRLVSEGVVEHRPYQGNFVRTFTPKQVDDLFEVRKSLEALAARAASQLMTPEDLDNVRAVVGRCHKALDKEDVPAFEAADREFHSTIVACARNDALAFTLRVLGLHIQLIRHLANMERSLREETRAHRNGIVAAMEARDGDRAAALLMEHIEEVQETVRRQLVAEPGPCG